MKNDMKTYDILFACDVACYGSEEIEAETPEQALAIALNTDMVDDVLLEAQWDSSTGQRIVSIEDGTETVIEDVAIDTTDGWSKAARYADALRKIASTSASGKITPAITLDRIWDATQEALR